MPNLQSARVRWALVVALGALALAALNIWWVERYRHGFPFDIDEAGYTTFGIVDYLGFKAGGLHGWWNAIQGQPVFAPLVPALTSLLLLVNPGVMDGFVTLTCFLLILTMAAYGVGEHLVGPRLGALAALVTATLPGTFAFSREYIFALPTAALLTCSVYAVLRSDGMRNRRWAIGAGVAIGLLLLARTMAIVYVPGVMLAALLAMIVRRRHDLGKRIFNLALLIVAAIAVAATWYVSSFAAVFQYLTDYGYGTHSKFYGHEHNLISWGRVRAVAEHMISEDLFVPLALLIGVGLTAMLVVAIRALWPPDARRTTLERFARTDVLGVALVFVVGYAGLMSSQNGGDGFTLPLAVLLPPLAVVALRRWPVAVVPAVLALAIITTVNVLSTSTIWAAASRTRSISLPGFAESLPVTKGTPKAVFAIRLQVPGPEATFADHDTGWLRADRALAGQLTKLNGPDGNAPVVAFASRNRAINSNTVQLASIARYHQGIPFIQLAAEPSDSVYSYIAALKNPTDNVKQIGAGEIAPPTALITTSRDAGDFPPLVTQAYVETAARRLGFRRIYALTLPDGRKLRLWRKRESTTAGQGA